MKIAVNPSMTKMCAFCRHFHDPSRKGAVPKPGSVLYVVDSSVRCPCTIRLNMLRSANCSCSQFKRKR